MALSWLGGKAPRQRSGVSWGVPWPAGTVSPQQTLSLAGEDGASVALQTWALATWPDGSLKWTGHAAVLGPEQGERLRLVAGPGAERRGPGAPGRARGPVQPGVEVSEDDGTVVVGTGVARFEVARAGPELLRSVCLGHVPCCSGVRLLARRERRRDVAGGEERLRAPAGGLVGSVSVEQRGPLRCVLRAEGVHRVQEPSGFLPWLPFVVRLYFYAGSARVRLVHTFVVDGEPEEDFCCGVGLEAAVPLAGPAYGRHVLFGGDSGFFREPAQLLWTWRGKDAGGLYRRQLEGEPVDLEDAEHARLRELLADQAVWRSFKLVQASSDQYRISKRVRKGCAWVSAAEGRRASGVAGVSGPEGGLALAVKEFWRKAPRSVEVDEVESDAAYLRAWLWSPDAEPMDLRHYDTEPHVQAAYEGFAEMRADARGVANTNEIWLEAMPAGRPQEALTALAELAEATPLLVCDPSWYHASHALGVWSLPEADGPGRAWVEAQLDRTLDFYVKEVEQRRWYGFWDYGDFMHSYDGLRHCWRYDLGGFAWQNTELVPNLWLWYSFLRTGRADVFRLAAAMARHTSEVDVYHAGPYAGLGSRHNVRHWGCACKEARISMAGLHRPFYYLTTDERVGDVMAEVAAAVEGSMENLDPLRTLVPRDGWPTHARSGPDWAALCSNWMTDWERTGNTGSLEAINTGLGCLSAAPLRMASGPVFGFDPATKRLEHIGDNNYSYHMVAPFGGPETWMELAQLVPGSALEDLLTELAGFAAMTADQRRGASHGVLGAENWSQPVFYARLMAFAAAHKADEELADLAWELLLSERPGGQSPFEARPVPAGEAFRPFDEVPWVSTGALSQWSLNVIECLELVPEALERVWHLSRERSGNPMPVRAAP